MLVTFSTRLYRLAEQESMETARTELGRAVDLVCAPLGMVVAMSIACAQPIIAVFLGPAYRDASEVLPWVSAGLVFWAVGSLMAKAFEINKLTTASWPGVLGATLVNAGLNLVAIPRWGARGAAAATLLGYFVYFLLTGIVARTSSLRVLARAWRPLIAAPLVGFVARGVGGQTLLPALRLVTTAAAAAVGYTAVLAVLREPHVLMLAHTVLRKAQGPSGET
jgi:O-antigen/teichoic acid export membrane protein